MYGFLAALVDILHAALMVAWVLCFPLLFWRRWPRVARVYAWYAVLFVVVSQGSHFLLGECVLTTVARVLRELSGSMPGSDPFTLRLVDFVAGIRPPAESIVLVWEVAMALCGVGLLWHLHASRRSEGSDGEGQGLS